MTVAVHSALRPGVAFPCCLFLRRTAGSVADDDQSWRRYLVAQLFGFEA